MTAKVDKDKCIGCGACVSACPEGYLLGDDGKAEVKDQNADCIEQGPAVCPVDAITVD